MLTVRNLKHHFGNVTALKGIDFSLEKNTVVGLLGSNGAGKTTTMRIIATLLTPSYGQVTIGGLDLRNHAKEIRNMIGYLPENPPLYPELTVKEYLIFIGKIRQLNKSNLKKELDRVLSLCSLSEVINRLCGELSKGFKQRVGLAQAIIHNPKLLILDEPTSGLDPHQLSSARSLLKELSSTTTIIFSSHILAEVRTICSRVIILTQGAIARDLIIDKEENSLDLEKEYVKYG